MLSIFRKIQHRCVTCCFRGVVWTLFNWTDWSGFTCLDFEVYKQPQLISGKISDHSMNCNRNLLIPTRGILCELQTLARQDKMSTDDARSKKRTVLNNKMLLFDNQTLLIMAYKGHWRCKGKKIISELLRLKWVIWEKTTRIVCQIIKC